MQVMKVKVSAGNGREYEIELPKDGENSLPCPVCSADRKKPTARSFRFNRDLGVGYCHHCDVRFVSAAKKASGKVYRKPVWTTQGPLTERAAAYMKARCISDDVIDLMQIRGGRFYMPQISAEVDVLCFPYFEDGEMVNIKYRDARKNFAQEKDTKNSFYNIDSIVGCSECVVVEGEMDCLSFMTAGVRNVISVPNGASVGRMEYFDESYDKLAHIERFYLAVDNDKAGWVLRDELIRRLGAERCSVITFGECKDANEFLQTHGSEKLAATLGSAVDVRVDGVFECGDLYDGVFDLYRNGFTPGAALSIPELDSLVTWVTGRLAVVTGIPGHGKALALETDIPTPSGFKKLKDIHPGDLVYGVDGAAKKVIAETDVQYDRPVYDIEFSDGTHVIADENHLWLTDTWKSRRSLSNSKKNGREFGNECKKRGADQRSKRHYESIKTTKEIIQTLRTKSDNRLNHSVKTSQPLHGNCDFNLPISPYTLGAWLGDGHSYSGNITIYEQGIIDKIVASGESFRTSSTKNVIIVNNLYSRICALNLLKNKHIPDCYLNADIESRMELLRGLLDTDGHANKNDLRCEISIINKRLADDIHCLVSGLGIIANMNTSIAKLNGKVISNKYTVTFTTDKNVFGLSRKMDVISGKKLRYNHRFIKNVSRVESVPVKCIQVEGSYYLCTRSCIPTHNSEIVDYVVSRLNLLHGWKVGYFSPENHPLSYHFGKIASKITGKSFDYKYMNEDEFRSVYEYMNQNYYFVSPEDDVTIDSVLDKARYLVRRKGIRMFVIDPYNKLEHLHDRSETETQYVSRFLDRLTVFARKNGVLVFLVAHPRKISHRKDAPGMFDVPTLYDISGSANFYNKADYGVTVYRNWAEQKVSVIVQKVKFKHWGPGGTADFRYNTVNGRLHGMNEDAKYDNYLISGVGTPVQSEMVLMGDDDVPF